MKTETTKTTINTSIRAAAVILVLAGCDTEDPDMDLEVRQQATTPTAHICTFAESDSSIQKSACSDACVKVGDVLATKPDVGVPPIIAEVTAVNGSNISIDTLRTGDFDAIDNLKNLAGGFDKLDDPIDETLDSKPVHIEIPADPNTRSGGINWIHEGTFTPDTAFDVEFAAQFPPVEKLDFSVGGDVELTAGASLNLSYPLKESTNLFSTKAPDGSDPVIFEGEASLYGIPLIYFLQASLSVDAELDVTELATLSTTERPQLTAKVTLDSTGKIGLKYDTAEGASSIYEAPTFEVKDNTLRITNGEGKVDLSIIATFSVTARVVGFFSTTITISPKVTTTFSHDNSPVVQTPTVSGTLSGSVWGINFSGSYPPA